MATGGGPFLDSDADRNCNNCISRHVKSKAIRWCPNCEEALCGTCLQHHSVSKLLKSHETVDISKLPDFIFNLKSYCSEHNERFELFCIRHQECCCSSCVEEKHIECSKLVNIKNVVKGVKNCTAFEDIEHDLDDVMKNFDSIVDNRIAIKEKVLEKKKTKVAEIREMREALNKHLDEIEEAFIQKVSDVVGDLSLYFDSAVQYALERKVKAEELKRQLVGIKEFQSCILEEPSDFQVEFANAVKSDKITTFGRVYKTTESASTVKLAGKKLERAQKAKDEPTPFETIVQKYLPSLFIKQE